MKLISVDELREYYLDREIENGKERTDSVSNVLQDVADYIENMADIQPRKECKWEKRHRVDEDGDEWSWLECSNCHYKIELHPKFARATRFCAMCGAMMEGGTIA